MVASQSVLPCFALPLFFLAQPLCFDVKPARGARYPVNQPRGPLRTYVEFHQLITRFSFEWNQHLHYILAPCRSYKRQLVQTFCRKPAEATS